MTRSAVKHRDIQLDYLIQNTPVHELRSGYSQQRDLYFLPLDLAHGAAACPVDADEKILSLSPQIALLLTLGLPIVGFGCSQDPILTNDRIGAAYAYGETSVQPLKSEMIAFSRGEYGYGMPGRSDYLLA